MSVTVLDQEMYTEAEAARLLAVSPSTLNYWLEGGERRGKLYEPIVRETNVLWEQVDAGVSIDEVAVDFGISPRDVRWAVSYESARAA
ncbi:MerR family transcriptional regulator [Amycolatopsis pigmentata]|uniref:Helix-turn-helix domain-containing protein n=1 Tax=Amycolatopsis pigmentata TaxID=450801 RepID=A0ABW5FYM6_9PSEU